MPIPGNPFHGPLARLPGAALLGGTAWAMTAIGDPEARLVALASLAAAGCISLLMQAPRPGQLPKRDGESSRGGSFLAGHATADPSSAAISLPWHVLDTGLSVQGPAGARSDLVAGIALQAAASGRSVLMLSFEPSRSDSDAAMAEAAERLGAGDDLWTLGGPRPTARLDPFHRLSAETVMALVAASSPALSGNGATAIQARLLLPAATALFMQAVAERSEDPSPDTFEDCLRLSDLTEALDPRIRDMGHIPPETRVEISRYLRCLPGHVSPGRQPTSVLVAHAAAESILRDGLAVIRGACSGPSLPLAADDLVAAGRICRFRLDSMGAAWGQAAFVVDLIATMLAMRSGASPVVMVDGFGALPQGLVTSVLGLREVAEGFVVGIGETEANAMMGAGTAGGPATRIVLPRGGLSSARIHDATGRTREFHPVVLSGRRRPRGKQPEKALERVHVPAPERRADFPTRSYEVLSRLLEKDFPPPPNLVDPVIEHLTASMPSLGSVGMDRSLALAIAGMPDLSADRPEEAAAFMDEPGTDEETSSAALLDGLLSMERFGGMEDGKHPFLDPAFDIDFGFEVSPPPPVERNRSGRIVFPASLLRDPGLAAGGWHELAGKDLKVTHLNGHVLAQALLDLEFPYWNETTARVTEAFRDKTLGRVRPLLLHGPRGIGKTRYARRICETVNFVWSNYPCGSASDASFLGASRQWSGARPGFVTALVARARTLNPGIVLDGIDAVSDADGNGSILTALRSLLDPETASRYHDPYLDVQIDLSRVIWIATASVPTSLPQDLLESFRVEELAPPGETAGDGLVRFIVEDLGRWRVGKDDALIDRVAEAVRPRWGGGSVRRLRGLVEEALLVLDRPTQSEEA